MVGVRLARPVTMGELIDGLAHLLTSVSFNPKPESEQAQPLIQRVCVTEVAVRDRGHLDTLVRQAAAEGERVLLARSDVASSSGTGDLGGVTVLWLLAEVDEDTVRQALDRLVNSTATSAARAEERSRAGIVEIADRVADELDGHVIVEDANFQLLAYSRVTDRTDQARREAILQRGLPDNYHQIFNMQGVILPLLRGEDVVHSREVPEAGLGPRLIVAIRHQGQLLGSIWFARDTLPYSASDTDTLLPAAEELAAILADVRRERQDDQIRRNDAALALIAGGDTQRALIELKLDVRDARNSAHVLTIAHLDGLDRKPDLQMTEVRVVAEMVARSVRTRIISAVTESVVHLVQVGCPNDEADCDAGAARLLAGRLQAALERAGIAVAIAIGPHAGSLKEIRGSAEGALRVLDSLTQARKPMVATLQDAWASVTLNQFIDNAGPVGDLPPTVERILTGRDARSAELRLTVLTAVAHWGEIATVARTLHVHPNTVRYRLRQLKDDHNLDLHDPVCRLAISLLLEKSRRTTDL